MQNINFPSGLSLVPDEPGVYFFKDKAGNILYIGKAKSLKNRVKSYSQKNLLEKTAAMVAKAKKASFIVVESELEALLLEARLIRKHKPRYNIDLRDDKTPLYIGITSEKFPRIITYRESEEKILPIKYSYGPFLDAKTAKDILKKIRRVFPFSTHKLQKRICIYSQIGLCKPCPSYINSLTDIEAKKQLIAKYKQNIRKVKLVLDGKVAFLSKILEKQMNDYSKNQKYEEALNVKKQLISLKNLFSKLSVEKYIENPNFSFDLRQKEAEELLYIVKNYYPEVHSLSRIECIDVAHLSGSNPTASLVVFINGVKSSKDYRHFKINSVKNNDAWAIKEVLTRRSKHFGDWGKPDLVIVDGGKPQLSQVLSFVDHFPIVGLAKREETLVFYADNQFIEVKLKEGYAKNMVVRIRDEAHRFARRLHHNLVTKTLLGK